MLIFMIVVVRHSRKIFHFKPYESIKSIIYFMQRLDFYKLYDLKRLLFINKLSHLHHELTAGLLPWYLSLDDIHELHFTYDITMTSTSSDIRKSVFNLFEVYVNNS